MMILLLVQYAARTRKMHLRMQTMYHAKANQLEVEIIHLFPVLSRPWESVSMDFLRGVLASTQHDDYLLVRVNKFSKMTILMSSKRAITGV